MIFAVPITTERVQREFCLSSEEVKVLEESLTFELNSRFVL